MSGQYVSKELTHLVGRSHINDLDKQYSILKNILTEKEMYATNRSFGDLMSYGSDGRFAYKRSAKITSPQGGIIRVMDKDLRLSDLAGIQYGKPLEERYILSAVCFCDILVEHLGIHMKKYGVFGLSFPKEFLIQKGVSPVFYISSNSPVCAYDGKSLDSRIPSNLYERFEKMTKQCDSFMNAVGEGKFAVNEIHNFLISKIFAFIKPFDAGKSDDDEQNYYMEREWRTATAFNFEPDDVCRIILPRSYAKRFNRDFDVYISKMFYAEEIAGVEDMLEHLG